MDYQLLWNEFFKQLFINIPSIVAMVASSYAAIKARDASNQVKRLIGGVDPNEFYLFPKNLMNTACKDPRDLVPPQVINE
jgi:hypothetical protein